jgi:ABC-type dipeptide/oligopeptide/nickel transport system permease component
MGLVLLYATLLLVLNFGADMLLALLDRRVKYE